MGLTATFFLDSKLGTIGFLALVGDEDFVLGTSIVGRIGMCWLSAKRTRPLLGFSAPADRVSTAARKTVRVNRHGRLASISRRTGVTMCRTCRICVPRLFVFASTGDGRPFRLSRSRLRSSVCLANRSLRGRTTWYADRYDSMWSSVTVADAFLYIYIARGGGGASAHPTWPWPKPCVQRVSPFGIASYPPPPRAY